MAEEGGHICSTSEKYHMPWQTVEVVFNSVSHNNSEKSWICWVLHQSRKIMVYLESSLLAIRSLQIFSRLEMSGSLIKQIVSNQIKLFETLFKIRSFGVLVCWQSISAKGKQDWKHSFAWVIVQPDLRSPNKILYVCLKGSA